MKGCSLLFTYFISSHVLVSHVLLILLLIVLPVLIFDVIPGELHLILSELIIVLFSLFSATVNYFLRQLFYVVGGKTQTARQDSCLPSCLPSSSVSELDAKRVAGRVW